MSTLCAHSATHGAERMRGCVHGGGPKTLAPNRNKTFPEKNLSIYASFCLFHPTDTNIPLNRSFSWLCTVCYSDEPASERLASYYRTRTRTRTTFKY